MPKDDAEVVAEVQHSLKCPSCLSPKVQRVPVVGSPASEHMECLNCGHLWQGTDFGFLDSEQPPIPDTK